MLGRIAKVLLVVIAMLGITLGLVATRFYNAGESTFRQTKYGQVIGFVEAVGDGTASHTWMGVPYASPPVGAMRWKAPAPVRAQNPSGAAA